MDFPGLGTALNVATVLIGALVGIAVGHRLPGRTRSVVTDILGLVTLLMAGASAVAVFDPGLKAAVGSGAMLVVLGALLIGGIAGSLLRVEERLAGLAGQIQRRIHGRGGGDGGSAERERFIEGWLTASLLFCVGPLTILGALDDGMGLGIDKLALKSVLDGFAAMAFAASFGVGVLLSAGSVLVIQGGLTLAGVFLGQIMSAAQVSALTATGGLMLVGIAFRLLDIKQVPVGDLLPALIVAPLLVSLIAML
ncbi:MAG: DUF554 domain-containing protein [Dermatophilaceae bacterium]